MLRLVLRQVRNRWGRPLALVAAVLVAVTGFSVLTASASTSRLEVRGTVTRAFRSTYDLLVRPPGSYSPLEREQGLIRANYQSGIFGGITRAQLDRIRDVPGVDVAAPVANIGFVALEGSVDVPISPYLTGAAQEAFLVTPSYAFERGLSRVRGAPQLVYVSRNRVTTAPFTMTEGPYSQSGDLPAEQVPGRPAPVAVCAAYVFQQAARGFKPFGYRDPYSPVNYPQCYYRASAVDPGARSDVDTGAPVAHLRITFPALLAAVDPAAEDRLDGLRAAVVSGRALQPGEGPGHNGRSAAVPVVAATTAPVDAEVSAVVRRVDPPPSGRLSDLFETPDAVRAVLAHAGAVVARTGPFPGAQIYERIAKGETGIPGGQGTLQPIWAYWQPGPVTSDRLPDGALRPRTVQLPASAFDVDTVTGGAPIGGDDVALRDVTKVDYDASGEFAPASLHVVGSFDPARVRGAAPGAGDPSGLAAQTYRSPELAPADAASSAALGGRPLLPALGIAGYQAQPPLLLTSLDGVAPLLATKYPGHPGDALISVVRVRVAGVTGPDPVSRERLRQAALAIRTRTGLAVDVVAGASGVPQTVDLPAGRFGRPALAVRESWAKKGVATAVLAAVDRKSVALFVLVLLVCALFVANAAGAAVRGRREELGVLSCLGWRPRALFRALFTELALLGLAAGVAGAVLSLPVGRAIGADVDLRRALLAVPAAVAVTLLAGVLPALRAARALPMDAVRPAVLQPRRAGWSGSVAGMALGAVRRRPGRAALAVLSLAIGVCALAMLLAVDRAFRGSVVGSLLGDAVALQVRGPDVVAVLLVVLIGVVSVADVLYLGVREHATEYATLLATGWRGRHLARLVLVEAVVLGAAGAVLGATAGLFAVWRFSGSAPQALLPAVAAAAVAGCALTCAAAAVPAASVLRLPAAALLAQE